ncbi:hypothetical protein [Aureimonas jatrophae]|uniref:Uncharacterized protein n=1 Tax=Aureimonas jatrophae TaxID=1166073 RepID=A0A1H0M5S8_9HYPH|nr:hypothetical protein [Aureimonas jatrophae]MBB3952622.1 hypothetical protein [Aureimonas jatrophae]SDO75480.1 hypothetical protein SAMN05192530_11270 [Aureimonas jatrophae]
MPHVLHAAAAILFLGAPTGTAMASDGLLRCGKCVGTTTAEASGIGTSAARVRSIVTPDDVAEYCSLQNVSPVRVPACIENTGRDELGSELSASADCPGGRMRGIDGNLYRYVGTWGGDDVSQVAAGQPKFARADGSVVATDHASGGRDLATNWGLLCGTVVPVSSRSASRDTGHAVVTGEPYDHNGSRMTIDVHDGLIVYAEPKAGIRRTVPPQTVLFRGDLSDPNDVHGTAHVFRHGCPPAPYEVVGRFEAGYQSTLVLTGRAPVRAASGCAVVGLSASSANALLRFEYLFPPEL